MKTRYSLPVRPLLVVSASVFLMLTGGCQQGDQPGGVAASRKGDAKDFHPHTNPGPHPTAKGVHVLTNPGPRPTYIIITAPAPEKSAFRTGSTANLTITLVPTEKSDDRNSQDNYQVPLRQGNGPKQPDFPTIKIILPPDKKGDENPHRPVFISMGDERPTGKHRGNRRAIFVHIPLNYPYPPPADHQPIPVPADP